MPSPPLPLPPPPPPQPATTRPNARTKAMKLPLCRACFMTRFLLTKKKRGGDTRRRPPFHCCCMGLIVRLPRTESAEDSYRVTKTARCLSAERACGGRGILGFRCHSGRVAGTVEPAAPIASHGSASQGARSRTPEGVLTVTIPLSGGCEDGRPTQRQRALDAHTTRPDVGDASGNSAYEQSVITSAISWSAISPDIASEVGRQA